MCRNAHALDVSLQKKLPLRHHSRTTDCVGRPIDEIDAHGSRLWNIARTEVNVLQRVRSSESVHRNARAAPDPKRAGASMYNARRSWASRRASARKRLTKTIARVRGRVDTYSPAVLQRTGQGVHTIGNARAEFQITTNMASNNRKRPVSPRKYGSWDSDGNMASGIFRKTHAAEQKGKIGDKDPTSAVTGC